MKPMSRLWERFAFAPKTAQEWNERLLFGILASIMFFGTPALISSVKMSIDTDRYWNLALYILAYIFGLLLTFLSRIPYKIRASLTVLLIFLLGLLALKTLGPIGSGRIYLFAAAILSALLLGTRAGFFVLAGIYSVVLIFTIMLHQGYVSWDLAALYDVRAWKVTTITFLFLSSVCTIAVSLLISGLRKMHAVVKNSSLELEITSSRLREEIAEHQKTLKDLKKSRDQLFQAQKMEAIGNLAGGIAHDFNNVLSPIIGMAELLMEDLPQDSPECDCAREIFDAGNRARDLVAQILAFSRQSDRQMMPVQFQQVLREVLKLCRSTIPSNIHLKDEIQQSCGPVLANPTQLHQIAMNLITNAYHATQETNGEISVSLRESDVGPNGIKNPKNRFLVLSVADSGTGISNEVQSKIFDPYFTTKGQGKGTGLGLAVVYGIVKEYGGDIRVNSKLGEGSIFNVYLPITQEPAGEHLIDESSEIKQGDERILLIDDEPATAQIEQQMLERLGYKVTVRLNGMKALEEFKTEADNYDIVISDMAMPAITGDQLADELKKIRPDIPIIICTGFSERINKEKASSIGVNGFLMKPIVKRDMASMVRNILDAVKP